MPKGQGWGTVFVLRIGTIERFTQQHHNDPRFLLEHVVMLNDVDERAEVEYSGRLSQRAFHHSAIG